MPYARSSIDTFSLASGLYANAEVSFYTVNVNGSRTATLANLYANTVGAELLANPQTLDAYGKFVVPVYIEEPVIAVIAPSILRPTEEETGIISNYGRWRGVFANAITYYSNDILQDPITGSLYYATETFTSSTSVAGHISLGDLSLALDLTSLTAGLVSSAMLPVTSASTLAAGRTAFGLGDSSVLNLASQAEAEAGAASDKIMSPLRTAQAINALSRSFPPGFIGDYAGASAPDGWLFCYGQAVSRTTYADLFTAIGTIHGVGDGSTTFNLPDLRGRVVAGQDDMGGVSANRLTGTSGGVDGDVLGGSGGSETHTLSTAEMPAHTHNSTNSTGGTSYWINWSTTAGGGDSGIVSTTSTGGGGAHNNVQPTYILNKIIKT